MRNKLFIVLSLIVVASMVLAGCATPTAKTVVETVIVKEVETQVVEKEGQTIVVTATPEPEVATEFMSKDPSTLVDLWIGEPETLDPALDYENAGITVILNVYETLITYDHEKPATFVPALAMEVPSLENGGISADGKTITFKIRPGVKFHDGSETTVEDVAYTFQRGLLQGGTVSPQWLLTEPLFGVGVYDVAELVDPEGTLDDDPEGLKAADPAALVAACEKVKAAVVADAAAGTVTFNLASAWAPFIPTMANGWGAVMSKAWTAASGGWDGSCDSWQNFYGKTSAEINETPIGSNAMGTGPFKLENWTKGQELSLVRFDDYWRTEPAWEGAPVGPAALERVLIKIVPEWGTRFAMFQAGDADWVGVDRQYVSQIDPMVGELCEYNSETDLFNECVSSTDQPFRLFKGYPPVTRTDAFMTFQINTSEDSPNPLIDSGKLDGNGIPPDFFADAHIRKAFNYCFDWEVYIQDALAGEAVQSIGVPLPGMPGYDPNGPVYAYDPEQCAAEFKAADLDKDGIPAGDDPEGDVWTTGFRVQVAYNTGNITRQTIGQILQSNLFDVNDKFIVEILAIPWASFLANQRERKLPMFFVGWIEDIHDPHNWYQPYIVGTYGRRQGLAEDLKTEFTALINAGVAEVDPAKRNEIYKELNQKYYEAAPSLILALVTGRHYEQRWVDGYHYNPIGPTLYYAVSKK